MTDKIRFKDENGLDYPGWKINIFSELYIKASEGGTPPTKDIDNYSPKEYSFVKIDDLNNKYLKETKDYISDVGLKKSSAWIVPANSILYSNGATIGACSINKIDCTTKQGILGIIPNERISTEFLYYIMSTNNFTKEVKKITTKGTMESAYLKDLNNIKIKIPCLEEQQKIADFLSTVDDKIENQKEIVKNLEEIKKGLIQKIFSQEIRFKDENGLDYPEWESEIIINLVKTISPKNHQIQTNQYQQKGKYKVIDQGNKTPVAYSDELEYVFNNTPIIVYGDHTTFIKIIKEEFVVGGDGVKLIKPIKDDIIECVYYSMQKFNIKPEGYKRHWNIFKDSTIKIPHSLDEQQKIADVLSTIDKKIYKEKNILNDWIDIKKGLLQRIF